MSVFIISERLRARQLLHLVETEAQRHHVTVDEILGVRRSSHIVVARHAAWKAVTNATGWSSPALGELFGVHHTTILYALGRLQHREVPPLAKAIGRGLPRGFLLAGGKGQ